MTLRSPRAIISLAFSGGCVRLGIPGELLEPEIHDPRTAEMEFLRRDGKFRMPLVIGNMVRAEESVAEAMPGQVVGLRIAIIPQIAASA